MANELTDPISSVITDLSHFRRDLLTTLRLLDRYVEGDNKPGPVSVANETPPVEVTDPQKLRDNLGHLYEHAIAGLEHVRKLVQHLSETPPSDGPPRPSVAGG